MKRAEWYTFWDDPLGSVRIEFFRGMAFLHVVVFSPMAGLRSIRRFFPALKAMLRRIGYSYVHVIIPEGDDKVYRFERLFGFEEVRRASGQILMRQEV